MFDLGWSKLLIIAILAIIVVGPKDLPALMRTIGKFVGQMKRHADEFRAQLRDAVKDTELEQIQRDVADIRRTAEDTVQDLGRTLEEQAKPLEEAAADIEKIGNAPEIIGPEGQTHADPTIAAQQNPVAPAPEPEPAPGNGTEVAAVPEPVPAKPNGAAPHAPAEAAVKVQA